jgi:hypothetical protein
MQKVLTYLTAAQTHRIFEIQQLRSISQLMNVVSDLVHSLQSERGSSNIYLASKGGSFKKEWEEFVDITNFSRESFHNWFVVNKISKGFVGGSRLLTQLALAIHKINQLPNVRENITRLDVSPAEATKIYSSIINALLSLVFEAADIAVDPFLSKQLVALFHLMQGKEFAGLERATGARICSVGKLPDLIQTMGNLIELQENCISKFESFSNKETLLQLSLLIQSMPIFDIEKMRRKLLSPSTQGQAISADIWFHKTTARMNDMHLAEKYLTNDLANKCDELILKSKVQLNDHKLLIKSIFNDYPQSPVSLLVSNLPHQSFGNESDWNSNFIGPSLSMAIIDTIQLQSKELAEMSQELLSVRATLDERKIIERAKGVLMAHQGINEEQAYVTMREKAMSQNKKLIDIAKSVLSLSEFLKLKN